MQLWVHNGISPAIEENRAMSFAGKWTLLEIVMWNELSQPQRDKCHVSPLWFNLCASTQSGGETELSRGAKRRNRRRKDQEKKGCEGSVSV